LLARLKRYAYAPIAALALWAVLLAGLPTAVSAQETSRANDQQISNRADRPANYVVVTPGDSLWSISERRLGPGATQSQVARGVERIYALNRDLIGADPNLIFVGQRFALPRSLERHASGQVARQAREAARVAHAGASSARPEAAPEATRTNPGAGSSPVRATGTADERSGEEVAGRTTKEPMAAHDQDAREGDAIPDEAAAHRVPALRRPVAGATPSSPASYLGGVRASVFRISSAVSTLMDAVATEDRFAGRRLLGWALFLTSSGIGVFVIIAATWRTIARYEREERWRRRAAVEYAAAASVTDPAYPRVRESPPKGTRSVRSEEPGRSENPAVSTQGENEGGSSTEGTRRSVGSASFRGGSAVRTKPRRTNRRRKVVDEDPKGPDRRGWQIGEDLRHSLEKLPLRPDALDDVLAELEPRVEDELRSLALAERRDPLSDREHRQASALRDLLALAREKS
jgi:nucleoid-associated protein YgaU